jgi:hypothetical protein
VSRKPLHIFLDARWPEGVPMQIEGFDPRAESVAWKSILRADPCAYCDARSEDIDHIKARSKGGADIWTNWVGACRSCNCAKKSRSLLSFLERRFRTPYWDAAAQDRKNWEAL